MKILTQNVLFIAPVFLFVSMAVGFLNYQLTKDELVWGLNAEATALAISLSAHLENKDLESDKTLKDIGQVLGWGKAKNIAVYDLNGNNILGPELALSSSAALMISEIEDGKILASSALNSNGNRVGTIVVETDARSLDQALSKVLLEAVWGSLAMLALGVLVASVISAIIKSRIKDLRSIVEAIAANDFNRTAKLSRIVEINDLGNTFNTMSSLLKDNQRRAEAVTANSYSRQASELAEVFNKKYLYDRDYCFKFNGSGFEVSASLADKKSSKDFFEVVETEDKVFVSIGRIKSDDEAQAILVRANLLKGLKESLERTNEAVSIIQQLSNQIPINDWQCLEFKKGSQDKATNLICHQLDTQAKKVNSAPMDLEKGSAVILTSRASLSKRINNLFQKLKQQEPAVIKTEISPLLAFDKQGATVILGAKQ